MADAALPHALSPDRHPDADWPLAAGKCTKVVDGKRKWQVATPSKPEVRSPNKHDADSTVSTRIRTSTPGSAPPRTP